MTMTSLMTHTDFLNSDPWMTTGTTVMMVPHMETVTVLAYLKVVILPHRMMDTALETTTVMTPPHMTTDTMLMMMMLFHLMVVTALATIMTTTYRHTRLTHMIKRSATVAITALIATFTMQLKTRLFGMTTTVQMGVILSPCTTTRSTPQPIVHLHHIRLRDLSLYS
ncbi:hypothetical protein IW144_004340 [Coemansia sp. RSA 522]|nr:hypothetical protein IW144_004340 [Coemansia sp. RSA 522]KAJ2269802.1 hypothetical protein J3F81_004165 [Coemansia sp. RSA 371]